MTEHSAERVRKGMDVYDADGKKVGSVEAVQDTHARVSTGRMGKDLHIPLEAAGSVDGDRVYLTVREADFSHMGWDQPRPDTAAVVTTLGAEDAWARVGPRYEQEWQRRHGHSGRWQDVEPAYRFGWERWWRSDRREADWATLEADLQREWETRHPGQAWTEWRASVRESWEWAPEVMHEAYPAEGVVTVHRRLELPMDRVER